MKNTLKQEAIKLRKQGKSYKEILKDVPVVKSTLSLWLRDVSLSTSQKADLQEKRRINALKGARKRNSMRIESTEEIAVQASKEIGTISDRDLFMLGIALYWSEGAKQKEGNISQRVVFSNSDPQMVKIFLLWLDRICHIRHSELMFELYIHQSADFIIAKEFWMKELKIDALTVHFKKHKVKVSRRNVGDGYKGLVRVVVSKSTNFNRKISGWIRGIEEYWGVV